MERWDATQAKRHFSQLLSDSAEGPQIVEKHGRPVSVVVSFDDFQRFRELRERKSVSGWLSELSDIHSLEGDMDEVVRSDRPQPDWEIR